MLGKMGMKRRVICRKSFSILEAQEKTKHTLTVSPLEADQNAVASTPLGYSNTDLIQH